MSPRPLRFLWLWRTLGRVLIGVMLLLALLPAPPGLAGVPLGDKVGHLLAFGLLYAWYAQLYAGWRDRLVCAAATIAFGLLIELLQALVPYRSADPLDLLADAAGVALAFAFCSSPLGDLLSRLEGRVPA